MFLYRFTVNPLPFVQVEPYNLHHPQAALGTRLKMSTKKHPGSRPPAKILTDNFEELKRVDNKSRRKFWKCNYCTSASGSGQSIEGRDNRCLLHLTKSKECLDAPPSVRNEARRVLLQKGAAISLTEAPLLRDSDTPASDVAPND
ncbi:hypothetical protein BDR04DRAFT_464072 [Suillus decipiens]|nr:hypothetical protein BDR04DRAFT_464072 [Suillus decipiens]